MPSVTSARKKIPHGLLSFAVPLAIWTSCAITFPFRSRRRANHDGPAGRLQAPVLWSGNEADTGRARARPRAAPRDEREVVVLDTVGVVDAEVEPVGALELRGICDRHRGDH